MATGETTGCCRLKVVEPCTHSACTDGMLCSKSVGRDGMLCNKLGPVQPEIRKHGTCTQKTFLFNHFVLWPCSQSIAPRIPSRCSNDKRQNLRTSHHLKQTSDPEQRKHESTTSVPEAGRGTPRDGMFGRDAMAKACAATIAAARSICRESNTCIVSAFVWW